jgi:hypothetical protein
LSTLAGDTNKFYLVDTRGTLDDSDWANELRPFSAGFAKVAEKFREALGDHFQDKIEPKS